jgi:hypothetical protein
MIGKMENGMGDWEVSGNKLTERRVKARDSVCRGTTLGTFGVPNYRISKAFLTLLVAVEGCLKNAWFGALNETLSA